MYHRLAATCPHFKWVGLLESNIELTSEEQTMVEYDKALNVGSDEARGQELCTRVS